VIADEVVTEFHTLQSVVVAEPKLITDHLGLRAFLRAESRARHSR
jgi:hypothetical protein